MEKIKISSEHEAKLEYIIAYYSLEEAVRAFINDEGEPKELKDYYNLNQFTLLLCEWYEVSPAFKVGDWVAYVHDNTIWNVTHAIRGGDTHFNLSSGERTIDSIHKDHIRKATPEEIAQEKERRKWAEIGRRVNQYINGDIATTGSITRTVKNVRGNRFDLEGAGEYFAEEVTLVCPVEKRMDYKEKS